MKKLLIISIIFILSCKTKYKSDIDGNDKVKHKKTKSKEIVRTKF